MNTFMSRPALFSAFVCMSVFLQPLEALAASHTAELLIVPSGGAKTVGQDFVVDIRLDTGGQAVGAVEVEITYSGNLEFVEADATGSVFDQELIAPNPSNNYFTLSRMRFDQGYNGSDGLLLRVTFLPLSVGNASVTINTVNSEVIAYADSTNILKSAVSGAFSLNAPVSGAATAGGFYHRQRIPLFQTVPTVTPESRAEKVVTVLPETTPESSEEADVVETTAEEPLPHNVPCLDTHPEPLAGRRGKLLLIEKSGDFVVQDVPTRAWYAKPIALLISAGIASGYRDTFGNLTGNFGPGDPVTYAELAKIALSAPGKALSPPKSPPRNQSAIDHWSEMYIATIEQEGISTFSILPFVDERVTRGAVVQTILEALDIPIEPHAAQFEDVPSNHAYTRAIATATHLGIIQGDTDENGFLIGTFRPDDSINRAEVAKVVTEAIAAVCK